VVSHHRLSDETGGKGQPRGPQRRLAYHGRTDATSLANGCRWRLRGLGTDVAPGRSRP
jgi:hypothetical protein